MRDIESVASRIPRAFRRNQVVEGVNVFVVVSCLEAVIIKVLYRLQRFVASPVAGKVEAYNHPCQNGRYQYQLYSTAVSIFQIRLGSLSFSLVCTQILEGGTHTHI